jgi:transposase
MVAKFVAGWRSSGKPSKSLKTPERITPKHAAILAARPSDQMTEEQQALWNRLTGVCPDIIRIRNFALGFRDALKGQDGAVLKKWIQEVKRCEFGPLVRFGYGLEKDLSAVTAAVETQWSSGQVEGQINRLKAIKRQMYGRARFNLLRARVLPYSLPTTAP